VRRAPGTSAIARETASIASRRSVTFSEADAVSRGEPAVYPPPKSARREEELGPHADIARLDSARALPEIRLRKIPPDRHNSIIAASSLGWPAPPFGAGGLGKVSAP